MSSRRQRAPAPTHPPTAATPGRRSGRRRDPADASDGDDPADQMNAELDEDGSGQAGDFVLAKKLVRYALACEYSRMPIRRDGIKEKGMVAVCFTSSRLQPAGHPALHSLADHGAARSRITVLGVHGRDFRRVLLLAQDQLKTVFGMELRALPPREKLTLREKRQAMKSNSQLKTGAEIYVLSTILPSRYRTPAILRPSKTPSADLEASYIAFYTLIVSAIWLSGGALSEQKLTHYLTRLNADARLAAEPTSVVLKRMEKHNYVVKNTDSSGQDGGPSVTWAVGPRAREEIGLDGVMGMVREVWGGSTPELEEKLRASLGLRNVDADADGQDRAESATAQQVDADETGSDRA